SDTSAVGVDFPPEWVARLSFCVDGHNHTLRPERFCSTRDKLRILDCRRVDRDLVGAGIQHGRNVVDGAEAAAYGKRDEDLVGSPPDDLVHDATLLVGRGDVEKDKLVGARFVVKTCLFDRVAGIDQIDEVDTFYDASLVDVEAGNNSFRQHSRSKW